VTGHRIISSRDQGQAQGHHAAVLARPRLAQLRHHRAGHDLTPHRGAAGRPACVSGGGAGISRYKERRRETESRIAETRENSRPLNDLRRGGGQADPPPAAPGRHGPPIQVLKERAQTQPRCSRCVCRRRRGAGVRDSATGHCETAMQERSRICASRKRRSSGFESISPRRRMRSAPSRSASTQPVRGLAHRAEHSACTRAAASPAHGFGAGAGSGP